MPQWTDIGDWYALPLLQSISLNQVEREESIESTAQIYFYTPEPYLIGKKDMRYYCMPFKITSVKNSPMLTV